jgi:hypothetical protein
MCIVLHRPRGDGPSPPIEGQGLLDVQGYDTPDITIRFFGYPGNLLALGHPRPPHCTRHRRGPPTPSPCATTYIATVEFPSPSIIVAPPSELFLLGSSWVSRFLHFSSNSSSLQQWCKVNGLPFVLFLDPFLITPLNKFCTIFFYTRQ